MQITAHSGSEGTADNSWEFIDRFIDGPADCIELDVRRDSDGDLCLGHDGPDADSPVMLADVFAALATHPGMKLNCDLKEPGLEAAVRRLGSDCGVSDRLQYSGTLDPDAFGAGVAAKVMYNPENLISDFYADSRHWSDPEAWRALASYCITHGVTALNVNYRVLDDSALSILDEQGVALSVWTVDDREAQLRFARLGVFNITTRRPHDLLEAVRC